MRGWQGLGVVDTILEEEEDKDEEEEEEESFNSVCASEDSSPSPSQDSPLPQQSSLQIRVKRWTQATGCKPNVVVQVQDFYFHLHKEALVARSGYFERHLASNSADTVSPPSSMTVETFAEVAVFFYGGDVTLTQANVAALWVAAEWLEMGGEAGLVRRAEEYFAREVATDAGRASAVLRSCAALLAGPEAEAAAAAEVAAVCIEVLATAVDDDGRWMEDMAATSAEEFGRIAKALRVRHVDDHDLLYRVVEHYLRNHDGKLTEEEESRICYNINCTKLSHRHLMHLVQNPRLPLRFVVQAMLVEQLHTRRHFLDRASAATASKPGHHHYHEPLGRHRSTTKNNQQLTLGAILHRDAAQRRSADFRAAMEATSARIQNLEQDIAGLRRRLRWSEEKRAEVNSERSASFRIVRPREGEVAEASCDGHSGRGGGGLGQRLVRGLRSMFRKNEKVAEKNEKVAEENESSVARSGAGGAGGEDGMGVKMVWRWPGHRRNGSFG